MIQINKLRERERERERERYLEQRETTELARGERRGMDLGEREEEC